MSVQQRDEADEARDSQNAAVFAADLSVGRTRRGGVMSPRGHAACAATLIAMSAHVLTGDQKVMPSVVTFFVYCHNTKGQLASRRDVAVSLIGPGGEQHLATTNAEGEVTIETAELFKEGAAVILFCDPQFKEHCATVKLESGFLKGFQEFNVQLPVFELVDRVRVMPK